MFLFHVLIIRLLPGIRTRMTVICVILTVVLFQASDSLS